MSNGFVGSIDHKSAGSSADSRGRDTVIVTINKGGAGSLASFGQYRLVFRSWAASQDRQIRDIASQVHIRIFVPGAKDGEFVSASANIQCAANSSHAYDCYYSSVFGTFRMNNGQDTWYAQSIDPGDEVVLQWGE
jgi:hypothetical protein